MIHKKHTLKYMFFYTDSKYGETETHKHTQMTSQKTHTMIHKDLTHLLKKLRHKHTSAINATQTHTNE